MCSYPATVSRSPSRLSKSSVREYCKSGKAPGCSLTSATILGTRPSSKCAPTPKAGSWMADTSSSAVSGTTTSVLACTSWLKAGIIKGRS